MIEPSIPAHASITHVVFEGLDGYRSVVAIEDALAEDVLLADHLDGQPLDSDHGAPVRLVSPSQYGYKSTKHLCRIELQTSEPKEKYARSPLIVQVFLRLYQPHPRARVWEEERHRHLPSWAVRHIGRPLIGPIEFLSARGSRHSPVDDGSGR